MNENISQYLSKYLTNPDPRYAVMLKGKWGCGKSFFIKQWIEGYKSAFKKGKAVLEPIYVSLYGLTDVSQITTAIDRVLHPYLYGKGAKTLKKVMKIASKLMFDTTIDLNKDGKEDISVTATLDSLALLGSKDKNAKIGTKLIVFDDLERSLIDMKLLLGYINNFVEHGACHVIILGDETHVTGDEKSKLVEFKEKTVGREFEIMPDVGAAVDSFINKDIIPRLEWLAKQKDFILDCFTATQCDNLRLLRQCLYDFSVLYAEVHVDNDKNSDSILMSLLGDYIITYCEYRGEFRQLILNHNWDYFSGIFGDEKTKENVNKLEKKYSKLTAKYSIDILDNKRIKQIIYEIEAGSSLKKFVEDMLKQPHGEVSLQDKLADFVNLSEDEFECIYNQLERDLRENNIVDQYLIGRTLALFLFFDYNHVHSVSKDTILAIKKSMDAYYQAIDDKELLFRERNAFYRGVRSYGKFNEYPIGKEFLEYYVKMSEKRESELKNLMEKTLLFLDDDNVDKLTTLSGEPLPNRHCTYSQTSIFKNVDSKIFANNVLQLNNTSLYTLCMFFYQHYEFNCRLSNIPNYYIDDLLTLKQVYEIIQNELSSVGAIRQYILKHFLEYLNGAVERAGGETNPIQIEDF